jgi:hypothetical protein
MVDFSPNEVFPISKHSIAQTAKKSLELLEKRGGIVEFDWENNAAGKISAFLVWTRFADEEPLRLTPREALAFCRGTRLIIIRFQDGDITLERNAPNPTS